MRINIVTDSATREVLVTIKDLEKNTKEGIREGFEMMGAGLVRTFENQALNEPKFGREYRTKDKNGVTRIHRASAAKQSPALLSGNYFRSVYWKSHGSNGMEFGNTAEYAEYLELGTKKMEARPGLLNAITASLKNSRLYLEEALDKNIKQ